MTPYERVHNRLKGKPVDKAPNLSILMAFAAKYIGKTHDQFCKDYKTLVEANIKCNKYFGIDTLSTISDPLREVYDFGAKVTFPYDTNPECLEHFITGPADIKKLKLFNPEISTRILDRLNAIELYKKEMGKHYSILGWIEGPFAEAADLTGVSEIMELLYDEPEFVKELMDICLNEGILCAKYQIKAGADIVGVGDAVASLVSPNTYREFILPLEKKLVDEIHKDGAIVKLHICGNINHLLDDIWKTGADIIDIDWMVDFKVATQKFKGHACVNGNFDPVNIVYRGTTQAVNDAVKNCILLGDETSFISAGCEIPRDTPFENLKQVENAINLYRNITPGVM